MDDLSHDGGDEASNEVGLRDITLGNVFEGVKFKGDLAGDFFLWDPIVEDSGDEEAGDEFNPTWPDQDPTKHAPVIASLNLLKELPLPLEELLSLMEDCVQNGGVKKLVLHKGIGKYPPEKAKVWYHYVGFMNEEQEPFDSTLGRNAESIIINGSGNVLPGLRIALETMEINEVAQFLVHHEYAYGKLGCLPRVAPEANIVFNIKLVHVVAEDKLQQVAYMTPEERSLQGFDVIFEAAKEYRTRGNQRYKCGSYGKSIKEYFRGVNLLLEYWGVKTAADEGNRNEYLCATFCNLAQCYLKLSRAPQACSCCKNALRHQTPDYMGRIYIIYAKAKAMLHAFDEAFEMIAVAQKKGGHGGECRRLKKEFSEAKGQSDQNYKEMCKSMFKMGSK